nr:S8 family serine peptidase [Enterobacter mori]
MNIRAVWDRGEDGTFATVRHLDFGVYRNHEDLAGNITVVSSRDETKNCDHGTASTGCIAAAKNGRGVTGIAHGCQFYFYDTGNMDWIVRDAQPGDIVSLDIQLLANGQYIPVTGSKSWWDKINTLVSNGVVVILAAGNGGLDLGSSSSAFADNGDNGSMLVGACNHKDGRRSYFSNYNHATSLINAWGDWSVTTTGYGTLQKLPGNERNYTNNYAGTSSATPLCAGALALIQSYAKRHYGVFLNSLEMRELIINTGSREGQGDGIGYRPNVLAATQYLDAMMARKNPPLAVAPADFSVTETRDSSRVYELDGSASQNMASCYWSIVAGKGDFWLQEKQSGPWVSKVNAVNARALIPANKTGEVIYRLTVIDSFNQVSTDDVMVTVLPEAVSTVPPEVRIVLQLP